MAKKTIKAQMKQRRDTKANWEATNPVLLDGELGIVSDDPNLYKVGDGATAWNSLPFRGFDGTLAQELGTSPNAVISQKVVSEKLTELESQVNQKVYIENHPAYFPIEIKGFLKKGCTLINNGVRILVADNGSYDGRIDVASGQTIILDFDKKYVQTIAESGLVDFEVLNFQPYDSHIESTIEDVAKLKEQQDYANKAYKKSHGSYEVIPINIKKGTTIKNNGVAILVADNGNYDGRIDIHTGESVYVDSDKFAQTLSQSGLVDLMLLFTPEKSISTQVLADKCVSKEKVDFIAPYNLTGEIKEGKYYSALGKGYNDSTAYDATSYIHITPGKSYCWNSNARFVSMLDANKNSVRDIESGIGAGSHVLANEGETYMVVTFYATDTKEYQVEEGVIPTTYLSPTKTFIDKNLLPPSKGNINNISFKAWKRVAEIASGENMTLPNINICKNIAMSAIFKGGTINNISMGVSLNGYYGKNVTITSSDIILKGGSANSVLGTFPHGITINDFAVVEISKGDDSEAKIRLSNDKGDRYEVAVTWGTSMGQPFIKNESSSALDVTFNFMPRDLNQSIWMFGDSYFGMYDTSRWPYYILKNGYNQFLLDAKGGEDATEGLSDLENLLSLGARPKYIVWCHGMNGGRDNGAEVNASWLSATSRMLNICEQYGITPILATIPSVPSEIHVNLNAWVKASGHRYIDFASAVETDDSLYWKGWNTEDALLSNDEVHPSVKGAIVLASQVMVDFPEITIVA